MFNRMEKTRKPPELIEIEPINICNLKCEICERSNIDYIQKPIQIMSFIEFKKIIDSYDYPINRFQFCGTAEPTLNVELCKMIKYLKSKKKPKKIELITNATLLSPKLSKELINSGLNMLKASIDGADKKTYESIRHFDFGLICQNLSAFGKIAKKTKTCFGINCTINKLNYKSLIKLPSFAKKIGVDWLEFRIYETNKPKLKKLAMHDKKILKKLKKDLLEECIKNNIHCDFWDIEEIGSEECNLETEVNINAYSFMTPCYHLPCMNFIKLGDTKFSKIWEGKKVHNFLIRMKKNKYLRECCCFRALKK